MNEPTLLDSPLMEWTRPNYSRSRVTQAGREFVAADSTPDVQQLALAVINNWRSSHGMPLNTFQVNLRQTTARFDDGPLIAQRTKRLRSITGKLLLYPGMDLARMQDIGGCRAVLSSVESVEAVADYYRKRSRIQHELIRYDPYIENPKPSGYRGIHLTYKYLNRRADSRPWNGLRIEIQLRSSLQHAWATAVETVGLFTHQALKSSAGAEEMLRFLALMSSHIANIEETPPVPGTPENRAQLAAELRTLADQLDIINRLNYYSVILQAPFIAREHGRFFVMDLDLGEENLTVTSHTNRMQAEDQYEALERVSTDQASRDVVMVSVDSVASLRRAYPNYFLDTTTFKMLVTSGIE